MEETAGGEEEEVEEEVFSVVVEKFTADTAASWAVSTFNRECCDVDETEAEG